MIRIPRIDNPSQPGLDFTREPWTQSACITGLVQLGGQKPSTQPTWIYVYYTASTLWLGFRCEGIPGDKLKTEYLRHDDPVWRDDSVDVILNPFGRPDRLAQIAVNAAGTAYDGLGGDTSWDPDLKLQVARDDRGWSAVIGIPFRQLGLSTPATGSRWTVNLSRKSSLPELICWAPVLKSSLETERFGVMIFGGPRSPLAQMRRMDPLSIGRNRSVITCPPGSSVRITGLDRRERPSFEREVPIGPEGQLEYVLTDDRVRLVSLSVFDNRGAELVRAFQPMQSPEVMERAARLSREFYEASGLLPKFPPAGRATAEAILAEAGPRIEEASRLAAAAERASAEDWQRLNDTVTDLRKQLDAVRCYAQTLAKLPDADFAVGIESPMRKVLIRDHPFDGRVDDHCELSMARNEHEAVQVVVIPFNRDLAGVSVSVGPLRTSSNHAFEGKTEISLVGHVDVADDPPYDVEYKGWWPDPLLSFLKTCDVKDGEHVAFWIDVATRPETRAGSYEGTISVAARDLRPVRLKLKVQVWDFALPDGTHLRNAFTYNEGPTGNFYGHGWNDEMRRRYHDFILDHRLNIDHLYRHDSPDIELLKYAASRGMNAFNVGAVFRQGKGQKTDPGLLAYLQQLKKANLFDLAYVYGFDEARQEKFPEIQEVFGEVHRRFPGLKTMTTAVDPSFGKRTGLRSVVDIWVPTTDSYNLEEARRLRREGRDMWWYICVVPTHPYANWFIEYPAIEARLLTGAMSYKYETGGFLYYLINLWTGNRRPISRGPYADWNPGSLVNEEKKYTANGDGSLMCPGPDGPLSTIRLENIRDGFEDYEYLWLLGDIEKRVRAMPQTSATGEFLARAAALLAVPDGVVTTTTNFTLDPRDVDDFRTKLAAAILEGRKLVK